MVLKFQIDSILPVRQIKEHKRTESTSSGRKISFNLESTVFSIPADRPITLPASKPLHSELRIEMPLSQDFKPKIPSPMVLPHPLRAEYKRTFSSSIKTDRQERVKLGHRRTQSYTSPSTHVNIHARKNSSDLKKMPYNRSSSNIANTREYYAAPAYNEASLLERKESVRSSVRAKNAIP